MARIAFAWELGGELGHAMACSVLARMLHARGHRIAFMFRELHQLAFLSDTSGYDVFQAPVRLVEGEGAPVPDSYADILVGCGYADPREITGYLAAWLALFGRWKPDLVVSDFAPTALLAGRVLGFKRVAYGNGFAIPPRTAPLPVFRFDEPVDAARVREAEARALASANAALAQFGAPPMANLCEQLETDEDFLTTFPEIDSYGERPLAGFWGPRFSVDSGASVHWPAGSGKRLLVYLKRDHPALDAIIGVLAASPHRIIAFIPELDAARRNRLAGPGRIVAEKPVRIGPLLKDCDLFVSQGGNMCPGVLMSGVPQLVFPAQYEQYLTARRMEQIGVGLWLPLKTDAVAVTNALRQLLGEPRFLAAARAYARRYPSFSSAEQHRRIVQRIEAILSATPSGQGTAR